jgi:hypothetical protein
MQKFLKVDPPPPTPKEPSLFFRSFVHEVTTVFRTDSFYEGAALIRRAMDRGCWTFLSTLVSYLTWLQLHILEQSSGIALLAYADGKSIARLVKTVHPVLGNPRLDCNFIRSLNSRDSWNEYISLITLCLLPRKRMTHPGPSKLLASLSHPETEHAEGYEPHNAIFNPTHPVVIVLYDNHQRSPCFTAHNFRPHSYILNDIIFRKQFAHTGYITASWSPDGSFLLVKSEEYHKTELLLFAYCAATISLTELEGWTIDSQPGTHSNNLWINENSFLAYPANRIAGVESTPARIHTVSEQGARLTADSPLYSIRNSTPNRGMLQVLNEFFYSEISHCKGVSESASQKVAAHSCVHIMNRLQEDVLNLHVPGLVVDLIGHNNKAYILWKARTDVAWGSQEIEATAEPDKCCRDSCHLGPFKSRELNPDSEPPQSVILTVLNLETKAFHWRSTCLEHFESDVFRQRTYLAAHQYSDLKEYNRELARDQPALSFTKHLLVINPESWSRYDQTHLLHLHHSLNSEPLIVQRRVLFHPNKNAHAVLNCRGEFPINIYSEAFQFQDFQPPLRTGQNRQRRYIEDVYPDLQ